MKLFVFALLLVCVVSVMSDLTLEQRWAQYKVDFERDYTPAEDARRFGIFKANVKKIDEHNAKGDSFTQGVNQFTDRTDEEFSVFAGGVLPPPGSVQLPGGR